MRGKPLSWLISWTMAVLLGPAANGVLAETPESALPSLAVSSEPADLSFPESTSVLDIYRAWGKTFGVEVLFDPKIKDQRIEFELHDVTALESLRLLNLMTYHFSVPQGEKTILVADDTPQNRRKYQTEAVQAFVLEALELKDAITLVRSVIGVRNIAAEAARNTLVVRDTADRVRVVAALLEILDKPRSEAAIDVEVFYLGGDRRDETAEKMWRGSDGGRRRGFPQRVSTAQMEHLREAARTLADPTLNVLSGGEGRWGFEDTFTVRDDGGTTRLEIGVQLAVDAEVRAASDEVELRVELEAHDATHGTGDEPVTRARTAQWSARLGAGESFLMSGFLRTAPKSAGEPGSPISFFDPATEGQGEILIALTPRIVREPRYTERDLAPLYIGTEGNITLPGRM